MVPTKKLHKKDWNIARVLVVLDLTEKKLHGETLVETKGLAFDIEFEYEKFPLLYTSFNTIRHSILNGKNFVAISNVDHQRNHKNNDLKSTIILSSYDSETNVQKLTVYPCSNTYHTHLHNQYTQVKPHSKILTNLKIKRNFSTITRQSNSYTCSMK